MRTVHKFPFELSPDFRLWMPINADIVLVEFQIDLGPCIWAKVDTLLPKEWRRFLLTRDGEEQPDMSWHMATFQVHTHAWHLWGSLPAEVPRNVPDGVTRHKTMSPEEFRKHFGTVAPLEVSIKD